MASACAKKNQIKEIAVDYRPSGARAVFLIETTSPEDRAQVEDLFADLSHNHEVIQLCRGKISGYCVQSSEPVDEMLDEIEQMLKSTHPLVVSQRSFDEVAWGLVSELAGDSQSEMADVPVCDICGKTEPFPTVTATLIDNAGNHITKRNYCESCSAGNAVTSNKEFIRSLLKSDKLDIPEIDNWEIVRLPSQRRPMKFRVSCDKCEDGCAGIE